MKGHKKAGFSFLGIFLLVLLVLPYFIPLPDRTDLSGRLPFDNSGYETLQGVRLHYRVYPAEGPVVGRVLLVHGFGGSTYSWRNNVASLNEVGYVVWSIDLPGFGYSTRQEGLDHSQEARSRLLWAFLDQVASRGDPWVLVGHSMGGGTVAAMAMERPKEVSGLILVDGALIDNQPALAGVLLRFDPFSRWVEVALSRLVTLERLEGVLESAYGRTPTREELAGYGTPLLLPGTAQSLTDMTRTGKSMDPSGLLGVSFPILYIRGEKDTWVPLEQVEALGAILPEMVVETIPGGAHCPMETHPAEFNGWVREFLQTL